MNELRKVFIAFALLAFAAILGVQIWTTYLIATSSEQILKDLAQTHVSSIEEEKVRQEAIAAKIQNARQGLFWAGLAGNISAAVAIIAALSGAWIGLSQYLSLSQKDREERIATARKEREENTATALKSIWEGLVDGSPMVRAANVALLQHYLQPE